MCVDLVNKINEINVINEQIIVTTLAISIVCEIKYSMVINLIELAVLMNAAEANINGADRNVLKTILIDMTFGKTLY